MRESAVLLKNDLRLQVFNLWEGKSFQYINVNYWGYCIIRKEKQTHQAVMEKVTPHIDVWTCTIAYVFNYHGGRGLSQPQILTLCRVTFPDTWKQASSVNMTFFQVIFVILYLTGHFQGKCLAFGSVIWFEFLQNLHLIGTKLQSFIQNPVYSGGW